MGETTMKNSRRNLIKGIGAAAMLPALLSETAGAQSSADGGVGPDTVYELRVYHLNEGMLPKIVERFRKKETAIFERLGIHGVAYWTAIDGPAITPGGGGTLIYILRHKSREAAT